MNPDSTTQHGVLLSILGCGVLITGASAAGKSELALALLDRHHQLVCDDAVEVQKTDTGTLIGRCPASIQGLMEVQGLGVLDIRDLFGEAAIKEEQAIEFVVRLTDDEPTIDRLQGAENKSSILGVTLPTIAFSKRHHRNLPLLVEIAVRNRMLKQRGDDPLLHLATQLKRAQA